MKRITKCALGYAAALSLGSWACSGTLDSASPDPSAADALASAAGPVDAAPAGTTPPPADVQIVHVVANGSGCPTPGSASVLVASDRSSFLVFFRELQLQNPPGGPVQEINCVAAVSVHVPEGWQFTAGVLKSRGYAFLEAGVVATRTSSYFFAGAPPSAAAHTRIEGPYDDFFSSSEAAAQVWSPCGGEVIFALSTSLKLDAVASPTASAGVSVLHNQVAWQWRTCH